MRKSRFTEEQIIGFIKEHERGISTGDLCRKHGPLNDASIVCPVIHKSRQLLQMESQVWWYGR